MVSNSSKKKNGINSSIYQTAFIKLKKKKEN